MKKSAGFILVFCFLIGVFPCISWASSGSSLSRSKYLNAIHEEVVSIVDGIEDFITRDYPFFWEAIEAGENINPDTVEKYVGEISNFRTILDNQLREFVAYKNVSASDNFLDKEKEILQMLSYAYLTSGNFITAHAIMEDKSVMTRETKIKISKLNGETVSFDITTALIKRMGIIRGSLDIITLDLQYFSPEDIETIDADIEVKSSDFTSPLNLMYAYAYRGVIPYNKTTGDYKISVNRLFSFLEKMRYFDLVNSDMSKNEFEKRELTFFLLKGVYDLTSKSQGLKIAKLNENTFSIEKKFLFKGLKDRGIRYSKEKEQDQALLVDVGREFKKNDYCEYGRYKINLNAEDAGFVNIMPCYRNTCIQGVPSDSSATPVKVFGHTLVLFEDIVDQVKVKLKHKKDIFTAESEQVKKAEIIEAKEDSAGEQDLETAKVKTSEKDNKKEDTGLGKSEPQKIQLFRGCSHKIGSLF